MKRRQDSGNEKSLRFLANQNGGFYRLVFDAMNLVLFFAIFVQLKLGVSHSAREACFLKWLTVGFELARYGCQPLLLRVSARISF